MEKRITTNNIELWTESFGDKKNPTIILIMGVAGQGTFWSNSFCEALAKDFFIIRYDHRDVGQSMYINYLTQPYTLYDLAHDIIGILDAYNIEKAHLVGASMGGYLAQICMQQYPERLHTITLLMSTVDFSSMGKAAMGLMAANDLPPPSTEVLEGLKTIGIIDPTNYDSWLFKSLEVLRLFNGKKAPFDEAEWVPLLEKAYLRRNPNINANAIHNHVIACAKGPTSFYDIKASCPVHVIHGSADPMLPVAHAHKTSAHYQAKCTIIENMGHQRPKIFEPQLVSAIQNFCFPIH